MQRALFFFLFYLIGFVPYSVQSQSCERPGQLVRTFEAHHAQPLMAGDTLSARVFRNFFSLLAETGIVTKQDRKEFTEYTYQLDEEIQHNSCAFVQRISEFMIRRLNYLEGYLETIKQDDLTQYSDSTLVLTNKSIVPANDPQLINDLRKTIRFRFLTDRYYEEDAKEENGVFQHVMDRERCRLDKIRNPRGGLDHWVSALFLKAIAKAYDPHSEYFSVEEKNQFETLLNTQSRGFGLTLSRDLFGRFEVRDITFGGPAWRTEKLIQGDIVNALRLDGEDISLACLTSDELQLLLSSGQSNELQLQVNPPKGELVWVTIPAGVMEIEENTLETFVLQGDKKIAYVVVPSFYTFYEDVSYVKGLSDDLAKVLVNLKREHVDGVVLDMRNNGGGSMHEAIKLVGMFINEGPVLATKNNMGEQEVLKDYDRGTVYDGPLAVLINEATASAAEIFASGIKLYNRGIIIGSSSYGKSTAQVILPAFSMNDSEDEGFAKITAEVFYNPDGNTYQGFGVVPHVMVPSVFQYLIPKEKDQPHALSFSPIEAFIELEEEWKYEEIKERSEERILNSKEFQQLNMFKDSLGAVPQVVIPLDEKRFKEYFSTVTTTFNRLYTISEIEHEMFEAKIPEYLEFEFFFNESRKEKYEEDRLTVQKDLMLMEAYNILRDQINLEAK